MKVSRYTYLFVFAILMYALFPRDAHAYLDPGSGSYIFQLIIAAVVGLGFMLRIYSNKVKTFVTGLFSPDADDERD